MLNNLICKDKQGTITGYSRHQATGDLPACDPCRAVYAEHAAKKRGNESLNQREERLRKARERANKYLSDPAVREEANRKNVSSGMTRLHAKKKTENNASGERPRVCAQRRTLEKKN